MTTYASEIQPEEGDVATPFARMICAPSNFLAYCFRGDTGSSASCLKTAALFPGISFFCLCFPRKALLTLLSHLEM